MTRTESEFVRAVVATILDQYVLLEAIRDDDGRIVDFLCVDANDATLAFTGRNRAQVVGARLRAAFAGHEAPDIFDLLVHTIETGEPMVLDDVLHRDAFHGGATRYFDLRGGKVGDAVGLTFRDVTERHEHQNRLAESEERFRLAMERSAIGMCLVAPDGHFLTVNPALCEMFGRDQDDLTARTWQELTHPEDLDGDLALVDEVVAGVRDHYRLLKRFLRADGRILWGDLSVGCVREPDGAVRYFVSQVVDVTEVIEARAALTESETHYRLLAENSSDVVYEVDDQTVIRWISPSVERVLGWTPAEMIGRSAFDFIDPRYSDDPRKLRDQVFTGTPEPAHHQSFFTKAGDGRWMSVDARPVRAPDGTIVSAVISLRDSHEEMTVRRAFDTLTAVNELLLRVHDERALLTEMCELAVDRGSYAFAWYGRPDPGPEHRVAPVATSFALRDYLDEVEVGWGDDPTGLGPTGRAIRTGATQVIQDFAAEGSYGPWRRAATSRGFRSSISIPVRVGDQIDGAWMVYAPEADAFTPAAVALLEELAGQIGYGLGRLRDAEDLMVSLRQRTLLGTAIDQAAEAVVVTDTEGRLLYVNPATTASSGYSAQELLGRTPRVFKSGLHDDAFYADMWGTLLAGRAWHGIIVNRRKDGELYEEDVAMSPVSDADGAVIAYVAVKRDLTHERRLEAVLSQDQRDREGIVAMMDEVRPTGTVEATAGALCDAACRLDLIEAAAVFLVNPSGDLFVAGITNMLHEPHLEIGAAAPLHAGEWIDALTRTRVRFVDLDESEPSRSGGLAEVARVGGIVAISAAPIVSEGHTLGILALGTATPEGRELLRRRAGLVDEIATFAGALFGRQVADRLHEDTVREDVQTILAGRRFHPEYQPIVDLATGTVCGYEALARFDDGRTPDAEFERARAVGLGSALEAAAAQAAIDGARDLDPELWLSVNFSPSALLDGTAAAVVRRAGRPLVIEVTEHAAIESYHKVRKAVAACAGARLSVDDAGAGFASLRHILELSPAFVKLDIGLVRGIDADPARQALAAGLHHFATQTGITLIAEGIETEAEAATLRSLGVQLGQGYLYGRPARIG